MKPREVLVWLFLGKLGPKQEGEITLSRVVPVNLTTTPCTVLHIHPPTTTCSLHGGPGSRTSEVILAPLGAIYAGSYI